MFMLVWTWLQWLLAEAEAECRFLRETCYINSQMPDSHMSPRDPFVVVVHHASLPSHSIKKNPR